MENTEDKLEELDDHELQLVSHAYCLVVPDTGVLSNHGDPAVSWEKVIVAANYKATLYAAVINKKLYGNNRVLLTVLSKLVTKDLVNICYKAIMDAYKEVRHYGLAIELVCHSRNEKDQAFAYFKMYMSA